MKGGDAVILRLAATVPEPNRDVTYLLYEGEEIETEFNGLYLLGQSHPELMEADFAILMEPSNAEVEAGCQGTLRVEVRATGERAHSARSWKGVNAIHRATPDPRAAHGVRAAEAAHRRAGVPRGPQRRRHPRRRRRQRAARRVRGRGQLPLRPRPQRGGGAGVRPRLLRGVRRHGHRQRPGSAARAGPAGGQGVHRGGGSRGQPQVRLDRRGTLHQPRDPRGQLRPRRPDARPQAGGARARGAHRALRAAAPGVVDANGQVEVQGPGHPAPRPGRRQHHRPAAARLARPHRLGARRPVAGPAHPGRVRRRLRRAGRARARDRGLRLGPDAARPSDVRPGPAAGRRAGRPPASR